MCSGAKIGAPAGYFVTLSLRHFSLSLFLPPVDEPVHQQFGGAIL